MTTHPHAPVLRVVAPGRRAVAPANMRERWYGHTCVANSAIRTLLPPFAQEEGAEDASQGRHSRLQMRLRPLRHLGDTEV